MNFVKACRTIASEANDDLGDDKEGEKQSISGKVCFVPFHILASILIYINILFIDES